MAIQISPLWVIGLSREGKPDDFIEAVDKQFNAFTQSHFGFTVPASGSEKWWGINSLALDQDISGLLDSGIPVELKPAYTFDANATYRRNTLSVVVYARFLPDKEEMAAIEKIFKQLRGAVSTAFTSYLYFVTDVLSENWSKDSHEHLLDLQSADACIILDECNLDQGNLNGYLNLYANKQDAEQNVLNRAAQIILNLGIGHDELFRLVQNGKKVFASGTFSLFFEKDVLKDQITSDYLTSPVLSNFFYSTNQENWHAPDYETETLKTFKKETDALTLYQKLIYVFDNKSKDVKGFFRHIVSPWSLFTFRLLAVYFNGEIRTLLSRLVEYGRLLDTRLMSEFVKHIEVKRNEAKAEILDKLKSVLLSVWENIDVSNKKPIGLQQFIHHLDEMKQGFAKTLQDINSPAEFYKVYTQQMPITPPDEIFDEYRVINNKFQQGLMANNLTEAEARAGKEEENLLNQLRNKLHKHPIPLGLFFRAGLLGMVLAVTTYAIIAGFLPDFLVNTAFFEEGAGRYLWMFLIFSGSVISALLYYGIGILGKIRNYKKQYLAWVFHRIQQNLLAEVKENLTDMLQELIAECQRIYDNTMEQLEKVQAPDSINKDFEEKKISILLNKDIIPMHHPLFPETYFQQNITEPIDKTSGVYFSELIAQSDIILRIPGHEDIRQPALSQEQLYVVMSYCLGSDSNYKKLCAELISDTPDLTRSVAVFHSLFNNLLIIPINHIGEFQFTADCYRVLDSRSYPSAFDYTGLSNNSEITRFFVAVGEVITNMTDQMKQRIGASENGQRRNLSIIATLPHSCNQQGYIQVCSYYRISAPENIRLKS
jgi:hypothetical protein